MCAHTYNIRELGNEQGLVWQEVYWKIGTSFGNTDYPIPVPTVLGWDNLKINICGGNYKMSFYESVSNKIYMCWKFCIYLLVMPKYWGKQIFTHWSFPEVGQKQKTERKERAEVGNNIGQLRIATPPRVAHAKPPWPIYLSSDNRKTDVLCMCWPMFHRNLNFSYKNNFSQ